MRRSVARGLSQGQCASGPQCGMNFARGADAMLRRAQEISLFPHEVVWAARASTIAGTTDAVEREAQNHCLSTCEVVEAARAIHF